MILESCDAWAGGGGEETNAFVGGTVREVDNSSCSGGTEVGGIGGLGSRVGCFNTAVVCDWNFADFGPREQCSAGVSAGRLAGTVDGAAADKGHKHYIDQEKIKPAHYLLVAVTEKSPIIKLCDPYRWGTMVL